VRLNSVHGEIMFYLNESERETNDNSSKLDSNKDLKTVTPFDKEAVMVTTGNSKNKSPVKKKGKLTKDDIGLPTHFEHLAHAGWDPHQKAQFHNFGLKKARSYGNSLDQDEPGQPNTYSQTNSSPMKLPVAEYLAKNKPVDNNKQKPKRQAPLPPVLPISTTAIHPSLHVASEQLAPPTGQSQPTNLGNGTTDDVVVRSPKPSILPRTKDRATIANLHSPHQQQQPVVFNNSMAGEKSDISLTNNEDKRSSLSNEILIHL